MNCADKFFKNMNFLGKKRSLLPFAWLEAIIMPNLEPNQRKEQVNAMSNVKKPFTVQYTNNKITNS